MTAPPVPGLPGLPGLRARRLRGVGSRPAVDVLVLATCLALALLPLVPVYGFGAIWPPIAGGLVLGTVVALVASRLGWSGVVTLAVGIVVYLVAGAALAVPASTVFAVVPTPAAVAPLLGGVVTVWKQVLTLEPVLGSTGSVLVAPYLLAFGGAWGSVSIARRAPGRPAGSWAAVVAPGVLAIAVLLGTEQTVQPVAAGVGLAVLLVGWVAWRRGSLVPRRVISLVVMGAVVAASGALVGPLLAQHPRVVLRDALVPPFDPQDHPSPLSGFRQFVKDWDKTDLMTVRGLPAGAPVRLATLDAFDGVVWNVAGAEAAQGSGEFRRVGQTIATSVRGEQATVEFEVHDLPLVWLPTVGYAERFTFDGPEAVDLTDDLRYNDATGTAVLTSRVPAGTRWTADVVVPAVPDDAEIGAATAGAVSLPEPRDVPDAVSLFAGQIAGSATSPMLIARSLEAGLADRGWFSHGLTGSGDYPSLSGHGADRLTTLLGGDLMVGDGEQYASAMALMARGMGLPARVVLGFVPDDEQAGAAQITLHGDDVQAWVEISFAGYGWVPFFPTPPDTKTPQADTPQDQTQPQPQVMQPPPPPADPVTPPDDDTEQPRTEDTEQEARGDETWRSTAVIAAAATVPLVVVLAPLLIIAAAKRRRRRRRRSAGDGATRVAGGWDEVLDHARDLHRAAPPHATRREIAVGFAEVFAAADDHRRRGAHLDGLSIGGAMAGLATRADALVFGRGEPNRAQVESYWVRVDAVTAAMRTAVPRRDRWRARWSVASLRARRSWARR